MMAERKGSLIAKSVSKHAGRAKEKILQNLGKVDRTADDIFDEHLENFNRQQQAAQRLQKEFNTYIRCVRAMQAASKTLYDCINDVYESGWAGRDVLYAQSQNIEMLWQDLSHKLADQVLLPLNTYYSQFPETKKKIDKRARKLVDYDGQRHNMQNLEGGGKKREETKITKAREQLSQAKRTYDTLNSELHDDLPALHHSRILFFVNNLQTLFSAEQLFHAETSKVFSELEAIIDKLANDTQKQSYSAPKRLTNSLKSNSFKAGSPISESSTADEALSEPLESPKEPPSSDALTNSNSVESNCNESHSNENGTEDHQEGLNNENHTYANDTTNTTMTTVATTNENSMSPKAPVKNSIASDAATNGPVKEKESEDVPSPVPKPTVNGNANASPTPTSPQLNNLAATETNNNKSSEEDYDIPVGATTNNLPPGVLYKVKATYRYNREDVDELSFEVGDIIRVVRYDDPEEQEDGWLMGLKETTGEKGMFPANFTRPI